MTRCEFCGQAQVGARLECGGEGEGICNARARYLDRQHREDRQWIRECASLIASRDVAKMRAACERNDRNGDFGGATEDELTDVLILWMAETAGVRT